MAFNISTSHTVCSEFEKFVLFKCSYDFFKTFVILGTTKRSVVKDIPITSDTVVIKARTPEKLGGTTSNFSF